MKKKWGNASSQHFSNNIILPSKEQVLHFESHLAYTLQMHFNHEAYIMSFGKEFHPLSHNPDF